MSADREFNEHNIERLIPWFRGLIAMIASLGLLAAGTLGSGHWIERSGKVMVAASLLFTFMQFRYESSFAARSVSMRQLAEKIVNEKGIPDADGELVVDRAVAEAQVRFETMRRRVFLHALATAGIGELMAAFGDIAFSAVRDLLC